MSQYFTCAVIGLGRIGMTLEDDKLREKPASHTGAILVEPRAQLVAGADTDIQARKDFESRFPELPVFDNAKTMIQSIRPEIVHIAVWTEDHPSLLKLTLEESIPVIICEKPLAEGLDQVEDLMDMAQQSKSRVIMNHERRFSSDYRELRSHIRSTNHGPLVRISTRLYMGQTKKMRSVLYHDGTHMLDILRFLTGSELEILHVEGDPDQKGGSLDVWAKAGKTQIYMEFAGGHDHLVFELDLGFKSGRIRIGNGIYERWNSEESPFYTGYRSLKKVSEGWQEPTGYFRGMMSHAIELASSPNRKNESSLADGYAVLLLLDKILKTRG